MTERIKIDEQALRDAMVRRLKLISNREFKEADEIRKYWRGLGVEVKDKPGGTWVEFFRIEGSSWVTWIVSSGGVRSPGAA